MTLRAAQSAQPSTQVVVPNPARISVPLLGPGRSRYPTPYASPSMPAAAPAPTPAAAPAPTPAPAPAPAPSAHEPTVLPNPSGLRRSSRAPATRTPMNLSRLDGMGEDPVLSSTEFDGVFPVGETHTADPPESSEVPNRFVLQLLWWHLRWKPFLAFFGLFCLFGPFRQKRRLFGRAATKTLV